MATGWKAGAGCGERAKGASTHLRRLRPSLSRDPTTNQPQLLLWPFLAGAGLLEQLLARRLLTL